MNAQRTTQLCVRRFLQQPTSLTSIRYSAPAILTTFKSLTQSRPSTTQSAPPSTSIPTSKAYDILARQRLNRPVSPHLSIYQPQIPWVLSGLNRITGSVLSGGFYLFGFLYLVSPLLGIHMESSALAASFAELPTAVKVGLKFLVAVPFTFHSFNGVRHLVWDSGREFANKSVVRTGWAVVWLTVLSSGALAVYGS